MTRGRGRFIVLEGLDGAGTTTQARMLHDAITAGGQIGHLTREPTDEPVGKLIRSALMGHLVAGDSGRKLVLSENVLCLLFAADRLHHTVSIHEHLDRGAHVVCDRYIHSSIAYQSLDPAITAERVIEVNRGIADPDVTFFIRVPVDECLARLERRNDTQTVYEKRDLLVAIERNYDASLPQYEAHFGRVIEIDGTQPPEAVHAAIAGHMKDAL